MERCKRCILPEDYPGIKFNEQGICSYCEDYKSFHSKLGEEALSKILGANGQNGKYDCVVPISGGKDSSYILYHIVKKMKLRAIAVNYNSGLQNKLAAENIRNLCSKLDVPLIQLKSKLTEKLIREMLLISMKQNTNPSLAKICKSCETMLRNAAINTAKNFSVKNIIWGSSALESGANEKYIHYKNLNFKINRKTDNSLSFGVLVRKFIRKKDRISKTVKVINNFLFGWPVSLKLIPRVIKYNTLSVLQRIEMKVPLRYAFSASKVIPFTKDQTNFVHFFDYIEWDSIHNVKELINNVGWKHPEGKEDRFDCCYHGMINLYALKNKGISADGINYCNFIREKKITRTEALKHESKLPNSLIAECNYVIDRVGLKNFNLPEVRKEIKLNG